MTNKARHCTLYPKTTLPPHIGTRIKCTYSYPTRCKTRCSSPNCSRQTALLCAVQGAKLYLIAFWLPFAFPVITLNVTWCYSFWYNIRYVYCNIEIILLIFYAYFEASRGAGAQACDCKHDSCGFDFHVKEWNFSYFIFFALALSSPLNS